MNWRDLSPEAKKEKVREALEARGLTYAQAAAELNTSRNSIAGVVNDARIRLDPIRSNSGLRNYKGVHKKQKLKPTARTGDNFKAAHIARRRRTGFNVLPALIDITIADTRPPLAGAWLALPGSSPVPLERHTNGCRWPIGDPVLYCNDPVEHGVYCPAHAAMASRPAQPVTVKRKATSSRMTANVNMAWEQS